MAFDWLKRAARAAFQTNYLPEEVHKDGFRPSDSSGDYSRESKGLAAVPAAYAAINILTDQLSMLPRTVRRGEYEKFPDHIVSILLNKPSRFLDRSQFWQIMLRQYITHGNSYAFIRREYSGRYAIELVPAHCYRTYWVQSNRGGPRQRYGLQLMGSDTLTGAVVIGRAFEADARNVLSFHGPGFNGLRSPSPIQYAAAADLQVMKQIMSREEMLLKMGDSANSYITAEPESKGGLSLDQWIRARDAATKQGVLSKDADGMMMLPPGMSINRLQYLTATDLGLIELLKWGVEDIARVFSLSPVRLGHYHEGMRVAGVEMQSTDFERYSIANHTERFEAQCDMKLMHVDDIRAGQQVDFDSTDVSLGTLTERIEAAELAVTRGGLWTINEGRKLTNQPPHPDGDRLLQPKGAPTQTNNSPQRPGRPGRGRPGPPATDDNDDPGDDD